MNQQTLLTTIHRHLSDTRGDRGSVRTLSEIVSLVASDIRQEAPSTDARSPIIPIGTVAAFADGNASDDEARLVLSAVQVDNSVIAELVAAVKAKQESQTETTNISKSLAERLLKMGPPSVAATGNVESPEVSDATQDAISQSVTTTVPDIQPVQPDASPIRRSRRRSQSRGLWIAAAVAATAAVWLALIYARPSNDSAPSDNQIASSPDPDKGNTGELPYIIPPEQLPEDNTQNIEIVESPPPPALDPTDVATPMPSMRESNDTNRDTDDRVAITPTPSSVPTTRTPTPVATPLNELVWTRITGLAASQNDEPENRDYSRGETWSALAESTISLNDANDRRSFNVVTLPLSRAEAKVQQNGRLVLASDSKIELQGDVDLTTDQPTASCVIDVQHGSVALADILSGTVIDLRSASQPVAKLRWDTDGSVVIGHQLEGFAVEIHSGTVSIQGNAFEDSLLVLSPNAEPRIEGKVKRMPGWVNRPIDTIPVTNVVLAQLSTSDNLLTDVAGRTKMLASLPSRNANDARTLATLAMWQATLSDQHLARLFSRTEPEIRNAALARLLETPAWDPRYEAIWAGVSRVIQSPRTVAQVKQMCENLRQRIGLSPVQIELLMIGLAGQSLGQRAMCDYLLRSHYGGGPPFDPAWTGQNQTRAINLWRRAVGN
ncbi:hypothetical protein [Aporhodopirellula aestuarii]|uniref:FecR protein domain-containing protein n=1 Tax=Aporhodopirellula aestuarii TaxID=2950107 RepID=A0ABT0U6V3_9BACT|nr:hypothetical protein [Aporhodopirellula aestuarii]MCM2372630.1 hypothetical protein [Aporhodopirellula aestuarii]